MPKISDCFSGQYLSADAVFLPFPGLGWADFSAFSLAGYTHRDALLHLQTKLCDWLAGGAHGDEDILFQCGHTGGHEWLGQGHEPGCTDANPYSEEVSESQNFPKSFSQSMFWSFWLTRIEKNVFKGIVLS